MSDILIISQAARCTMVNEENHDVSIGWFDILQINDVNLIVQITKQILIIMNIN